MTRTTSRPWLKYSGWTFIILLVVITAAAFTALANAQIETTTSGVHTRLLVPLGRGAIGLPLYAGSGDNVQLPGFLAGPVVRRAPDGGWTATWFCENTVQRNSGYGDSVHIECAGRSHDVALNEALPTDTVASMPDNVVVLSDIEGNDAFLDAALRRLGVTSTSGKWHFGNGHLVILGDSVDRGRDVFAVLWRLHDLASQAQAAGGAVHVLLGNHEQYLLRGNVSRAHPEYRYALQQLGGYAEAFSADSVLGAWLRQQPVVLKLGSVLFVHAGISPQVANGSLSIDVLNRTMHDYWYTASPRQHTAALDAVLGLDGITQYRGYFRDSGDDRPSATKADVEQVLSFYGAERIVVGHTLVESVENRFDGRVIAVDVNDNEARTEVLTFAKGEPNVIDIGISRNLDDDPPRKRRGFSLSNSDDRHLLAAMYRANRALGRIPYPY